MASRKQMQEMAAALGAKGGRARAAKLPPERRSEIARKAGKARQARRAALSVGVVYAVTAGAAAGPAAKKIRKTARKGTA